MQTLGIHSDSLSNIIQAEQNLAAQQEQLDKFNKKEQQAKIDRSAFRKIEHLLHPALLSKSSVCKH